MRVSNRQKKITTISEYLSGGESSSKHQFDSKETAGKNTSTPPSISKKKMPFVRQLIDETIKSGNLEEAFYVCNVDDLIAKHQNWLLKMPRIRPFYAVKCNNTTVVLETLAALGLGFDCASKAEIDSILDMGVSPGNIIYANPLQVALLLDVCV